MIVLHNVNTNGEDSCGIENVEELSERDVGQGLTLRAATVRCYRGTTRLEIDSKTETMPGTAAEWADGLDTSDVDPLSTKFQLLR